jgi:uncharacterized delta-60 repeat protein
MSHKRTAVLAMWCSLGLLGASSAQAAPGDLDPTFSGDGLQFTDFGPGPSSAGAVARQSDGKIVTVGGSAGGFALARYNPDGSLDTSFSDDGKQTTSFGDFDFVGRANGVALQPDGKIVVVGDSGGPGFALARYNPDGSLDTTFSEDGKQTTDFGAGFAEDVVVQPDGKIVAVGTTEDVGDFALARYDPDGSLDTTFSGDGKQTTDFGEGTSLEGARGVVLQPDGKVVVAGDTSGGEFGLARYDPDGSLDTSFSDDGKETTDFGGIIESARDVALQPDGKIVVGGDGGPRGTDFALARYDPDGSLDTSFSDDGKQTTDFADPGGNLPADSIGGIALQEDGKIIAAGASRPFAFGPVDDRFALARYNPDGSLDTSFSEDGKQITSFGDGAASDLALRADGKIVAVGSGGPRGSGSFALARYNLDGSLDTTFSEDGKQTTEFAGFDSAEAVALQPDGKIVAVGGVGEFALARYNPDGSLDTSFSEDGKQTTAFGGTGAFGSSAGARGVALQSDGKIIVVGGDASGDFALARYNPDGSLDTSFSDDGLQITEFDGFDSAASVVLQPDGKIVAAGRTNDDFAVARYNSDGTLDTTFSGDGLQVTSFGGASRFDAGAQGVALQPDGKIVVVGGGSGAVDDDFALARYNPDGSLDTTFSDDGKQTTDFTRADSARGVALQPDGKIVVVGDSSAGDDFALARYNPDGSLDTTFSDDGKQTTDFGNADSANGVALQPDGKILAVGSSSVPGGDSALARYNPDGSLDTSFSGDGKQITDLGGDGSANAVALQPDGMAVVAGSGRGEDSPDFALARYEGGSGPPVDTTPPQTSITAGPTDGSTSSDRTPTFEFTSSEPGSMFRCRIDGGGQFGCESPFTTSVLADGRHTFSVAATDAAGNTDPTPATRTFTVRVDDPDPDPGPEPDPDPQPQPQPPTPQPLAPQPPAPQPPAPTPVQSGPPVEGDPGYTYPAKLRVARAEVDREERQLDVFAPLTSRAFGEEVDVTFRAAGRTGEYNVEVTSGDAAFDRLRFRRTITREQADLETGIVTIKYPGNAVTRPQEVRLRAARRQADLQVEEISLEGDRLSASGTLDNRARGVVRLELSYLDGQGRAQVFKTNVEIDDGEWSVDAVQVPGEIAQQGAYVSVLFTGYFERRIRGEMISYQIEPGQTRRP